MSKPIDPRNEYGIRGYNGLWIKACELSYPDRMGDGAERTHRHIIPRKLCTKIKRRKCITEQKLEQNRPEWHGYVYGGKRKR